MSCKTFHSSLKLKELSAVPLSCPVFHQLCYAHSLWGFSLIPFSRSGSPLNSLSVQAVETGKTYSSFLISLVPIPHHQCFPLCPENCQCGATLCVEEELLWVAHPGPWVGERDNRRSRLQYKAGLRGHILTPCKKQSSRIWVQQGGKVPILCLRGWKISTVSEVVFPLCWYLTYRPSKQTLQSKHYPYCKLTPGSCNFLSLAGNYSNTVCTFMPKSPTTKAEN